MFSGVLFFAFVGHGRAATVTWTGGGTSDDTSLGPNWGGSAPVAGDFLHFTGSVRLTPNQVAALSVGSLTFDSGAGAFTLGGNTYTITTASGVTNNSTNTETINNNLTLGIAQTWTAASGNLVFGGNIANGGFVLTIGGSSNTSASGVISGTGSLTKTGTGTLTLSGANTYSGGTTINRGTLTLDGNTGSLASSGGLTFGGTGTFNYQGATTGSSQTLGSLSFVGGDGAVQSTYGSSGNTSLTFSSLAARTAGATENFITTGGTNGTTDKIVLTGVAAGFISQGTFFNGSDFAFMNAAGTYVRGINYGVDANSALAPAGTTIASGSASKFILMTGTITSQATLTINTLNISGAYNLTLGTNKTLTLTNGGLLKSGGGASTISGGTGITPGSGVELVIRTDASSDSLTISSVILANGTNALTKSGAGTLTLSGTNTYTGVTTIDGGTLSISADSNLGTAPISATAGKLVLNGGTLGTTATITLSANRGILLGSSGGTFDVASATTLTYGGIAAGNGSLTKTNTGTLTLSGVNTYTGATNINAGTLKGGITNAITSSSAVTVATGATYDLNGFADSIGSLAGGGTVTSGVAGAIALNVGTDNTSTLFSGVLQNGSGTVSLTKSGTGTLTLSGLNTYTGQTLIQGGTVSANTLANLSSSSSLGAPTTAANGTIGIGSTTTAGTLRYTGATTSTNRVVDLAGTTGGATLDASGTGGLTFTSAFTATGAGSKTLTLTGTSTANNTIAGAVVNNSVTNLTSLVKSGTGTWVLSGTNTYSGGTTINAGILSVGSDANLGATTSSLTLNAGTLEATSTFSSARSISLGDPASTFQVDSGIILTILQPISGTGTLNKTGTGTMVLSAVNLFSGGTSVTAGTLQLSLANGLVTTAGLTISGGTFDLQTFGQTTGAVTLSSGTISGTGAGALTGSSYALQSGTVSAVLAGSGALTKSTSGTVILSGSNTFTGSTTINAGILQVNANNALGSAASGTTVATGAVLKLNNVNYATAEPLTLNGSGISNGGALVNSGTSTFSGPINAATNATINAGGGTLNLTGGLSKNGTTLTIAGGGTVNITTNGITGSSPNSDLVIDGTTVVLSAASSYNGPTTIQNSGTLELGGNNVLPSSPQTAMTINTSSVFDLAGYSDGVASITGDSSATIKNSAVGTTSTLTVNPASGSTTFDGVIAGTNGGAQGNIALQKNGAGTLILTGTNTYSGSTTVNGGTLTVANNSGGALGSTSSIAVNSGGTLLLGASDQINNTAPMTLAGGTFAKGDFSEGTAASPGVGALTLTASGSHIDFGTGTVGVLTFASFAPGSFTLTIDNWTGSINTVGTPSTDRLIFASDQSANLNSFVFTGFGPGAVEFNLANGYYEVTPVAPVPETSTWVSAALGLGVAGLHFVRRRRRAKWLDARENQRELSPICGTGVASLSGNNLPCSAVKAGHCG